MARQLHPFSTRTAMSTHLSIEITPLPPAEASGNSAAAASAATRASPGRPPHVAVQVDPPPATENNMQDADPTNIQGNSTILQHTHLPKRVLGIQEYQSPLTGVGGGESLDHRS